MAMLAVHATSLKKARLTSGLQVVAPELLTRQCCCCGGGVGGGGMGSGGVGGSGVGGGSEGGGCAPVMAM
eukprot:scaffold18254_cov50-Phaeocystis_antarctica.AAC.1